MQDKKNIFLKFITASNTPFPIFKKIGLMFPNTTFQIEFADEDIGSSNCGIITITNSANSMKPIHSPISIISYAAYFHPLRVTLLEFLNLT